MDNEAYQKGWQACNDQVAKPIAQETVYYEHSLHTKLLRIKVHLELMQNYLRSELQHTNTMIHLKNDCAYYNGRKLLCEYIIKELNQLESDITSLKEESE